MLGDDDMATQSPFLDQTAASAHQKIVGANLG
ncbi:hypothetical protein J2728_002550 [Caulobacter segnis]|nr:hypothetical protein [Caulobacter segnis]